MKYYLKKEHFFIISLAVSKKKSTFAREFK